MPRMRLITACFALFLLAFGQILFAQQQAGGPGPHIQNPVVVQFMIDGIDPNTVRTAVAAGATNIGSILKQGVTVQTYYCASPAPRLQLPDGSLPKAMQMRFAPNTGYAFAVGSDTWHSADPVGTEVETRDSILLTYFVDAGLLRILRNRGKRIGNFLLSEAKHAVRK